MAYGPATDIGSYPMLDLIDTSISYSGGMGLTLTQSTSDGSYDLYGYQPLDLLVHCVTVQFGM